VFADMSEAVTPESLQQRTPPFFRPVLRTDADSDLGFAVIDVHSPKSLFAIAAVSDPHLVIPSFERLAPHADFPHP